MNDTKISRLGGTTTVILLSFLLFYLPSMLAIFSKSHEPLEWILISVAMSTLYTAVFCLNYFWFVPAMLIRSERKPMYFVINFCLILFLCSLAPVIFELCGGFPGPRHQPRHVDTGLTQIFIGYLRFVLRDGVMMVLSAGLAYALRLSRERENVRRQELELDVERRKIELKSLKAQLNPHFLFNSLNNIYALIGFAPERAQQALHDLSNMLRFMIYDSTAPTVPLDKELQFIRDYVELMKLRLNSNVRLSVDITTPENSDLQVAPLLFLTIVENAFKHSGPGVNDNFISISITIAGDSLKAIVKNSYPADKDENKLTTGESGVGLANIKRQLRLIYPEAHTIDTCRHDGVFYASISILTSALKASDVEIYKTKTFSKE